MITRPVISDIVTRSGGDSKRQKSGRICTDTEQI